jgi:hypothetical protein
MYFVEGWRVVIADLPRVIAVQPNVFVDSAEERARAIDPADLLSIAGISLPLPEPVPLPAQFDPTRQAWIFSARNPNLRITGQFGGQVAPGTAGFGFTLAVSPSFMQVAGFDGRLMLRDGYHRAYGLLRRGITRVPVFYRQFATIEELHLPQGMLPQAAYLGDRPATIADYLDNVVAASVDLPATQKMIVISGLELAPIG